MEGWNAHFPRLDARSHFNMTLNASAVRAVPWTQSNTTRKLIASLQLQQVQTLRTTHLTIGIFSLALALLTVHRIVVDARRAAALQVTLKKMKFKSLRNVHPAETFPLALACGAVIQQIIFVAVQSTSLHSVLSNNCRGLSMATFPALFIIGFITLVFGFEMAWRSVKRDRFAPRGKWNTTICIAIVSFLVVLTWVPTIAWPMYNRCFGSLIWFSNRYDLLTLIILCVLVFFCIALAGIISVQLMRHSNVDPSERIAASRMTYYLLVVGMVYILVIPVEVQSLRRDFMNALATARVAEVSLFASGMLITFLHLFLRTNATRLVIRPMEEMRSATKQVRPKIRFFGPSDLELTISGPMALQGGRHMESRHGLIDVGPEKNRSDFDPEYFIRPQRAITPLSTKPNSPIDLTKWPLPPDVEEGKPTTSGSDRARKSYSLFPTRAEEIPRLPATVYDPSASSSDSSVSKLALRRFTRRGSTTNVSEAFDFLSKPRPLFSDKHNRMLSTDSSATVQIGLRFSVAPATLAAAKCTKAERDMDPEGSAAPSLKRNATESSESSLGLPIQKVPTPSSELSKPSQFPSPPARARVASPARFPVISTQNSSAYLQTQREKVLPAPPPRSPAASPKSTSQTIMNALRMNPISPTRLVRTPTSPLTPGSARNTPSPTARIPLGAGTMSRTPPRNGWI